MSHHSRMPSVFSTQFHIVKIKQISESLQNNTMQTDNELSNISLGIGIYYVELYLHYDGPVAAALQFQFAFSGTATGTRANSLMQINAMSTDDFLDQENNQADTNDQMSITVGFINVTAQGTLDLNWAQSTTTASNSATKIQSRSSSFITSYHVSPSPPMARSLSLQ